MASKASGKKVKAFTSIIKNNWHMLKKGVHF
jgi:hypothetical protein